MTLLAVGVTSLSLCTYAARPTDKLLSQFDQYVQGEFDNYNQVNFETNNFLDDADVPAQHHARLYQKVVRVDAPELGTHVYYQQLHSGGKHKPVYRQSLMVVSADHENQVLVSHNYKFHQGNEFEDLWLTDKTITSKDVYPLGKNCQAKFRFNGGGFAGGIDPKACSITSAKGKAIHIKTQQFIGAEAFWHLEEGFLPNGTEIFGRADDVPHILKRAQNFKCWAAFKTDRVKPNGEAEWDFFPNQIIHDQGDIAEFVTSHETPQHYFIRLKQTEFPAGKRPDVFEMFIHENSEQAKKNYKQALSYTWTNKEAKRLGINLRWMQSSCTLIEE